MKTFNVLLSRVYSIEIEAMNKNEAKELIEFFTSHITDISNEQDRKNYNFKILNIEPKINEAFEVEELSASNKKCVHCLSL
jgi:hypothetical protein